MPTDQTSPPAAARSRRPSGLAQRAFAQPEGMLGRLGGIIVARGNSAANSEITGLLAIRAGDRVLEIGYGPGELMRHLAEQSPAAILGNRPAFIHSWPALRRRGTCG